MSKFTQYTPTSGPGSGDVTAAANLTDDAVVVGDGGGKGVKTLASLGTSGQILTSNGAGSPPSFQDNSSVSGPGSSTDNALSRWNGTTGDTLQDSTVIVDDNGYMTNANQPYFIFRNSSDIANVTGDGTVYTPLFSTQLNQHGNIYDSSTGVMTAPVEGRYFFTMYLNVKGITSSHTDCFVRLDRFGSGNVHYTVEKLNIYNKSNPSGECFINISALIYLYQTQTITPKFSVSNGTKVITFGGGTTSEPSIFACELLA